MKYAAIVLVLFFFITNSLFAQRTPVFDSSFAVNGIGRYPLNSYSSIDALAATILQQSDGKIINVVNQGYGNIMVRRLFDNGSVDSSFGQKGAFLLRDGQYSFATAAALSADDKIIITATTNDRYSGFYVIRLDSEGKLDNSFNGKGSVNVYVRDSCHNNANDLNVQPDGKIVVVGSSQKIGVDTSFAIVRLNINGSLDEGFGQSGKVVIRPDSAYENVINAVTIQKDNKIVLAGASYRRNSISGRNSNNIAVLRLNQTGILDSSFNNDGEFFFIYDNYGGYGSKVAIQDDNKIVVAGSGGVYSDYLVIRLNKSGALDNSFGENGKKLIFRNEYTDYVKELKILQSGKILIGGVSENFDDYTFSYTYFVQLNNDGSNDLLFGDGGIILYNKSIIGLLADFTLRLDNKLWLLCNALTIATLNSDGSIDSSFNDDGKIQLPYFESNSSAKDMAIAPDGKMVIAGYVGIPSSQSLYRKIAVLRLNKDGSPDSTFNNSGTKVLSEVNIMLNGFVVQAVAIQKDGKIVVVTDGYSVVRLNENGSIDSTFGENGQIQILGYVNSSYPYQQCAGLAIQEDGKIVVAGNIISNGSDYYVVRLNMDGSYDQSFSKGGKKTIKVNGVNRNAVGSIAISANNTIIVSGISYTKTASQVEGNFSSIKLKSDGSLDSSFGKDGTFLYTVISDIAGTGCFALDSVGRILMYGSTSFDSLGNYRNYFIRLKNNAEFDSTFGNGGIQEFVVKYNYLNQILPQSNGKILLDGFYKGGECYFQQLLDNGVVDSSFAQNGEYIIPTPGYMEGGSVTVVKDSNGKIVLATSSQFDQPGYAYEIMRFMPADIVLPIKILNINAALIVKDALISWQTANEINTSYFNLQRSLDGRIFYTIGKVNATGNNAANYSYKDLNVSALKKEVIYYRLQQFDKDGSYSYSKIVSVTIKENDKPQFSVYPNPAKQKLVVVPLNTSSQINKAQVSITDMSGKIVYTVANVSITASGMEINVAMLAKGMYIIAINSDDKITKLKFLKE